MMTPLEKRPSGRRGTKAVFSAVAALLVAGIVVGMVGMKTGAIDPMWGGVLWGSGFCLGLYGLLRLGAAEAKPAIERAGSIVERAVLIRKTQTMKASQRFAEAKALQRRIDSLTAQLWPGEARVAPLPPPPKPTEQGKTTRQGGTSR